MTIQELYDWAISENAEHKEMMLSIYIDDFGSIERIVGDAQIDGNKVLIYQE